MDKKKYGSSMLNASITKKVWMLIAVGMIASNLLLAIFVVTADTSEKTVVQPFNITREYWIKGDKVSASYLEQVTETMGQRLLTYQKRTARNQFDRVLEYAHPSVYSTMSARFKLDADRISRNDIGSVWHPHGVHTVGEVVYVTGEQQGFVGAQLVSKGQRIYSFTYGYENGVLHFYGHDEIKKNSNGDYEIVLPDEILLIEQNGSLTSEQDLEGAKR